MASTENLEEIDLEDYINERLKKKLEKMNYTFDDLMNKVKKMNLLEKKEEIIPTKENAEFYKGQILKSKNNINYRSVPHLTKKNTETKYIWSKVGSLPETRYLYKKEKQSKELTEQLNEELTDELNLLKINN
jgi:Rps23 Pro-64 3,4-dihydroxylase Tpa1-like proline 4-hydroxylase